MDSHSPATKYDLHYVQMEVKHVQAVQINHAERLLRLERRQADDAALRSVWGSGSPFPGVLSGTPVQGDYLNLRSPYLSSWLTFYSPRARSESIDQRLR